MKIILIAGGAIAFRKGLVTVTSDQNLNTAAGAAAGFAAYLLLSRVF